MNVFKFGGASVKNAEAVRNVGHVISLHLDQPLMVVVSAMGKTTNALEKVVEAWMAGDKPGLKQHYEALFDYHRQIVNELFPGKRAKIHDIVRELFWYLEAIVSEIPGNNYNFEYDRIVSFGEVVSTHIVSHYLNSAGMECKWLHAPELIRTDPSYRDARIDWNTTTSLVKKALEDYFSPQQWKPGRIAITQGFLGGTQAGYTTTLGREGSDFSAAILAFALNAKCVTIWKDVPGLLNADPKIIKDTILLDNISYQEAIELSYYGATVIHPKTLKPLFSKNIPLRVRSFEEPELPGTIINNFTDNDTHVASYIFKFKQVLLKIFPRDFSFIAEHNLSLIFSEFARHGVKINLMQNSAISFSVCFDFDKTKTPALINELNKFFDVKYQDNLELITIRHYTKTNTENILEGKETLLEQKSRTTLQLVVRNNKTETF